MYLKFRYKLGYEALVAEVSNNISWRLFCRIGLSGSVPEASTLCKLTSGRAKPAVATLNDALLTKLVEQGTVKGRRTPNRHDGPAGQHRLSHGHRLAGGWSAASPNGTSDGCINWVVRVGTAVEGMVKRMAQSRTRVKEQLRQLSQQLKKKDRPAGVRQAATKIVVEEAERLCAEVTAVVGASEQGTDEGGAARATGGSRWR